MKGEFRPCEPQGILMSGGLLDKGWLACGHEAEGVPPLQCGIDGLPLQWPAKSRCRPGLSQAMVSIRLSLLPDCNV